MEIGVILLYDLKPKCLKKLFHTKQGRQEVSINNIYMRGGWRD